MNSLVCDVVTGDCSVDLAVERLRAQMEMESETRIEI